MARKDTGLSGFADTQEEVTKERVLKTHIRIKGAGKVRHSQLRFYDEDNWKRAHLFALDQGISLNMLAVLGISKLMEERGLPALNLEEEGGWRRTSPEVITPPQSGGLDGCEQP
jgi:hypothetical protein